MHRRVKLMGICAGLIGTHGCGGSDRHASPGDVNVWSWNIAAKSLQMLKPAFEREHPGIRVDVDMTGASMQSRLLLSLTSGVGAPDVSQLQNEEAPRYITTGRLADLTPVAGRYASSFPAALWQNCLYHGRVYAIPWDVGPCGIYYKREVFQKYHIAAGSLNTWDDYIAAGRQIMRLSGGQTRMLPVDTGAPAGLFVMLLQQAGGQVFDAEGRVAVNSPEAATVLNLLRRMIESGICARVKLWSQEFNAGFNADTIATYPGAVWLAGIIRDASPDYGGKRKVWGIAELPALTPGGTRASDWGGSVLVIPAQSKNRKAAWAFLEYALCTTAGQVQQYQNEFLFPAYLPALKSPVFDAPDPLFSGQRIGRLFAVEAPKLPLLYRTRYWMEATTHINQTLSRWISGGMRGNGVLGELEQLLHQRLDVEIAPRARTVSAPKGDNHAGQG